MREWLREHRIALRFVGVAVTAGVSAYGFADAFRSSGAVVPAVVGLAFAWLAFIQAKPLIDRLKFLEQQEDPRYFVVFDPADTTGTCVQEQPPTSDNNWLHRRYRIRVTSNSSKDLEELHAVIVRSSPPGGVEHGRRLHPMAPESTHGYFGLPRGGTRYVEILAESVLPPGSGHSAERQVLYDSPSLHRTLLNDVVVRFAVEVLGGGDAPPQSIEFELGPSEFGTARALRQVA
jgi:hypothetical protein